MSIIEYSSETYKPIRIVAKSNEYGEQRFVLEFEHDQVDVLPTKNILFIGLNPADATLEKSDKTANKILEIAQVYEATKVTICNICSFCSPYFSDFEKSWMMEHHKNLDELKQSINQADMIIVFWGEGAHKLEYEQREEIYNLLQGKDVYIGGKTSNFFPKHIAQRDNSFVLQDVPVKITKTLNL